MSNDAGGFPMANPSPPGYPPPGYPPPGFQGYPPPGFQGYPPPGGLPGYPPPRRVPADRGYATAGIRRRATGLRSPRWLLRHPDIRYPDICPDTVRRRLPRPSSRA